MKKIGYLLLSLTLLLVGCSYDDDNIWNKVNDIEYRLAEIEEVSSRLNKEIEAIKIVLDSSKTIVAVTETKEGYVITFSDGDTMPIKNGKDGEQGKDGKSAPIIGVKKANDGLYYWTLTSQDTTEWLLDESGYKLAVEGKEGAEGITPQIGVDDKGFWTVNYGKGTTQILDEQGNPVKAHGDGGESLFKEIDTTNPNFVIFHLTNGEVVVVKRTDAQFFFNDKEVTAPQGETMTLDMNIKNIHFAEALKIPEGWDAEINLETAKATIVAPKEGGAQAGMLSFIALDNKNNTLIATVFVKIANEGTGYTNKYGTFVLAEGNMTTVNGTLFYYDEKGVEHADVFEKANAGAEVGNVLQDMFIANNKIYFITKMEINKVV